MMYNGTKFVLIAIFGIHKRINGSNFAKEAQRNKRIVAQWSRLVFSFKYLKIYEESKSDI